MKTKKIILGLLLIPLILFQLKAKAQPDPVDLELYVFNLKNQPISGCEITISSPVLDKTIFTDSKGKAALNLPRGIYDIRYSKAGYARGLKENFKLAKSTLDTLELFALRYHYPLIDSSKVCITAGNIARGKALIEEELHTKTDQAYRQKLKGYYQVYDRMEKLEARLKSSAMAAYLGVEFNLLECDEAADQKKPKLNYELYPYLFEMSLDPEILKKSDREILEKLKELRKEEM